ncbi:MAG TPA: hypothetical protein DDY78_21970 [Planctomycetales bacterium]|jgi:hypothetical protein|nr:hypothetical protein [Planctomycetales bacterium]
MKLELENAPAVINPDGDAITSSLAAVRGFAILSRDEMTYIQTSGPAGEGFTLEYQDGDTDRHYRCPDELSLERVTQAFVSYARGTDSWKTSLPWVKEDV